MNISNSGNTPAFQSRCPEIKLGQQVCHLVNSEFPHYSMTKFHPIIDKHISKIKHPSKIMFLITRLEEKRPSPSEAEGIYTNFYKYYFLDLFNYIKKHHAFNCHESSLLSALLLKLKGIKNVYTACVRKGTEDIDHVICFFNRDGSEYDGKIKNNQTIIVDAWTGICDFANNVFTDYTNIWNKHFNISGKRKNIEGKYQFYKVKEMNILHPDEFSECIKNIIPNPVQKNISAKKG